jgi:hypothetical protein
LDCKTNLKSWQAQIYPHKKRGLEKVGEQNRPPNGSTKTDLTPTAAITLLPSQIGVTPPVLAATKIIENSSYLPKRKRLIRVKFLLAN